MYPMAGYAQKPCYAQSPVPVNQVWALWQVSHLAIRGKGWTEHRRTFHKTPGNKGRKGEGQAGAAVLWAGMLRQSRALRLWLLPALFWIRLPFQLKYGVGRKWR